MIYIYNIKIAFLAFIITLFSVYIVFAKDVDDNTNTKKFIIFHTSDVNGMLVGDELHIGYAKLFTLLQEERKKNKNVLLLDSGDTLFGTILANSSRGELSIDILNELGLSAYVPGNNDFYYDYSQLESLKKRADFPMLVANIIEQNGNKSIFAKNLMINLDGYKIGIFGLMNPQLLQNSSNITKKNLAFLDPINVAKSQVKLLQNQGANLIIALTHLGLEGSTSLEYRSLSLSNIEGLDLILDGHSQLALSNGLSVSKTLISQSGSDLEYVGKITIEVNDMNETHIVYEILSIDDFVNIKEDKSILKIIKSYEEGKDKRYNDFTYDLPVDLYAERDNIRRQPTTFSILLCDALKNSTNVDIVMINAGMIKRSMFAGKITYDDIFASLPFENTGIVVEIKGWEIKSILEKSVSKLPDYWGGFLQTSGITYDVDAQQPVGNRVSNIKVANISINNDANYKILINNFLYNGRDGYIDFIDRPIIEKIGNIDLIFMNFLKKTSLDKYEFTSSIKFLN